MVTYEESKYLTELATDVINENPERFEHLVGCRIAYQYSSQEKKSNDRLIFADCEKVKDKYKCFLHLDFIITVYEPNVSALDDEHLKRILFHELLHVGWEPIGEKASLVPHDQEDFRECIERWGIDWMYK